MAAAVSIDAFGGPTAVRVKNGPRERFRSAAAGAKSFESRSADVERRREEGRLDERERTELLFCWSGNGAAADCRSTMGAVIDRLHRGPPREGRAIEDAIERELVRAGRQGMAREKLVNLLALEDPKTRWSGATKHEIRSALRGMRGRLETLDDPPKEGEERDPGPAVEYFVEKVEREKSRKRELPSYGMGMLTGPEQRETLSGQLVNRERQGKAERETVEVEMVRIAYRTDRKVPPAVTREERWARDDRELEAELHLIHATESSSSGGSRLPPHLAGGRADAPLRALRRLPAGHRRVIERAYSSAAVPLYAQEWAAAGEEVARLAPLTASVEAARRELVAERSTPATRSTVERATFAADAMRAKLDAQPEGDLPRLRWKAERERFVEAVRKEAAKMLADAVEAYRSAREG